MPLPDFRVVPGESLTLEIELFDSADQVTLQLLSLNTATGTLVVAGSAASVIAPGGRFYVDAPGLSNRGPFTAATVTADAEADTTAITFSAYTTSADIETGSVEVDLANNAFVVTIADADAIPYVAGGWVRVSGNSTAAANRAYRIWSVSGGPASNQVTVRVEQPLVSPHASTGALQVLGNWPVLVTAGSVIPAAANPVSVVGHTITCDVRAEASTSGSLLFSNTQTIEAAPTFDLQGILYRKDLLDPDEVGPGHCLYYVDGEMDVEVGDTVLHEGITFPGQVRAFDGEFVVITSVSFVSGTTRYFVSAEDTYLGQTGGITEITGTTQKVTGSSRYTIEFTAEQTAALADRGVVFFDILHEFTSGSLPATPVRARVTCGGVTLVASVAAGTDHLRIPSSPWRVRIVPAVTEPEGA